MDDVQALRQVMEQGFAHIAQLRGEDRAAMLQQRAEDRVIQTRQHADNVERLVRIEERVIETNGRVSTAEAEIVTLFKHAEDRAESSVALEQRTWTFGDAKWNATLVTGTVAAVIASLKLMGEAVTEITPSSWWVGLTPDEFRAALAKRETERERDSSAVNLYAHTLTRKQKRDAKLLTEGWA